MIFEHVRLCEDGENSCQNIPQKGSNVCKKYNQRLGMIYTDALSLLFKKCFECIIVSKELYPELYI